MDVKLCRHSMSTLNLLKWRVSVNTAGADKVCWNVSVCVCLHWVASDFCLCVVCAYVLLYVCVRVHKILQEM